MPFIWGVVLEICLTIRTAVLNYHFHFHTHMQVLCNLFFQSFQQHLMVFIRFPQTKKVVSFFIILKRHLPIWCFKNSSPWHEYIKCQHEVNKEINWYCGIKFASLLTIKTPFSDFIVSIVPSFSSLVNFSFTITNLSEKLNNVVTWLRTILYFVGSSTHKHIDINMIYKEIYSHTQQ